MEVTLSSSTPNPVWSSTEIQRLNTRFADRQPADLIDWAATTFGQKLVLTCSFGGASGMVLLDMVASLGYPTPVVFLDTDLLFPETYALAERAARRYGVKIERRHPTI